MPKLSHNSNACIQHNWHDINVRGIIVEMLQETIRYIVASNYTHYVKSTTTPIKQTQLIQNINATLLVIKSTLDSLPVECGQSFTEMTFFYWNLNGRFL